MKKIFKIVLIIVVVVAILGSVGQYYAKKLNKDADVTVRIETPKMGDLIESVNAPADIEPWRNIEISARISARILDLPFDEGAVVTAGNPNANPPVPPSLLVKLDDSDMAAMLESSEARRAAQAAQIEVARVELKSRNISIQGTEVSLEQARRQLARKEELLKTGDVTESEVEDLRTKLKELEVQMATGQNSVESSTLNIKVMEEQLRAADADISRAREELKYTTIFSPIDGVVTKMNAEMGEIAMTGTMNNAGTVILEVADLNRMLLKGQVDEIDVAKVSVGQEVKVKIQAFPEEEFKGKVDACAMIMLQDKMGTKCCKVEVLLDNPQHRILSGMTADVEIIVKKHSNVMKVPSQAVLGRDYDSLSTDIRDANPLVDKDKAVTPVVYRYIDGEAVETPVKIGASDVADTIILEGLSLTDKIITGPYKELEGLKHKKKVKDEKEVEAAKAAKAAQAVKPGQSEPAKTEKQPEKDPNAAKPTNDAAGAVSNTPTDKK